MNLHIRKFEANFMRNILKQVNDIKEKGYRSVPLKNKYSERLLLSSLLVYVRKWKVSVALYSFTYNFDSLYDIFI